jgi:Flp pilus assembly protein TadG
MIAAQVALCMIPLCGVAAFAIDCGMIYEYRRRTQAAADAAALAAAEDLYAHYMSNSGTDPKGTAAASATSNAYANGFTSDGWTSAVTVNIPPKSGNFVNQAGFAEVIVTYHLTRGFSGIFSSGTIPITSRAVARGLWTSYANGIILLNPTGSGALTDTGNGTLTVNGGSIIVDSDSASAAQANGNGVITASQFLITGSPGDVVNGKGKFVGGIDSSQIPTLDPLGYLTEPSATSLTVQAQNATKITSSDSTTLDPGVYVGGISISGKGSVTLNPGTYFMEGGGFSLTGQANLSGSGVTIYNLPSSSSDTVSIAGQGTVTLSPPTSGEYQGITVFQDRTSSAPVSLTGNGGMNVTGTIYAANALATVTGNGSNNTMGGQYVVYDMTAAGNGNITVNWQSNSTSRTRKIGLVE